MQTLLLGRLWSSPLLCRGSQRKSGAKYRQGARHREQEKGNPRFRHARFDSDGICVRNQWVDNGVSRTKRGEASRGRETAFK